MRLLLTGALGTRAGRETIRAASAVRKNHFPQPLRLVFWPFVFPPTPPQPNRANRPRSPFFQFPISLPMCNSPMALQMKLHLR